MPKNVLYSVIQKKTSQENKLPAGVTLVHQTNTAGSPYFLFNLPKTLGKIGDYTLDNHHVSVFYDMDGKSQYHYTAIFKDTHEHQFRLHIFYNSHDGYDNVPGLARIGADGGLIPVLDCEEYHEAFKALAKLSIAGVVTQLRKDQKELVDFLMASDAKLDKEAIELSKDLEKNQEAYVVSATKRIAVLEELLNYSNKDEIILGTLKFLINFRNSIESTTGSPRLLALESKDNKESSTVQASSAGEAATPAGVTVKDEASTNKKKTDLPQVISKLDKQLTKLKNLKADKLTDAIAALNISLVDIEIAALEQHYKVTSTDIFALNTIRTSLGQLAGKRLQNILLSSDQPGRFTEAAKLSPFYKLLPETLIDFALTSNDDKLLEFLLKNKITSPDYNNFYVKNIPYSSLVDYCFKQAAAAKVEVAVVPTTPVDVATAAHTPLPAQAISKMGKILACFDVLIKNGLSFMEIDPTSGLPFAAVLLLNSKHPLRPVFEVNRKLTINNPMFLKQLNQVLHVILAQPDCAEGLKVIIPQLIVTNRERVGQLRNLDHSIIKAGDELALQAETLVGTKLVQKVNADPDIIKLDRQINAQFVKISKKLPVKVRSFVNREIEKTIEKMKESLAAFNNLEVTPKFKDVKKQALQMRKDGLQDLANVDEFLDLRNKISTTTSFTKKPSKKVKQMLQRQDALLKAFKASKQLSDEFVKSISDAGTVYTKLTEMTAGIDKLKTLESSLTSMMSMLDKLFGGAQSLLDSNKDDRKGDGKEDGKADDFVDDLGDVDFLEYAESHSASTDGKSAAAQTEEAPEVEDDTTAQPEETPEVEDDTASQQEEAVEVEGEATAQAEEVDLTHRFFGAAPTVAVDSSVSKPGLGLGL
jgi:hypothetical protein